MKDLEATAVTWRYKGGGSLAGEWLYVGMDGAKLVISDTPYWYPTREAAEEDYPKFCGMVIANIELVEAVEWAEEMRPHLGALRAELFALRVDRCLSWISHQVSQALTQLRIAALTLKANALLLLLWLIDPDAWETERDRRQRRQQLRRRAK